MTAHLVADITITNPVKYSEYLNHLGPIIGQYGGKLVLAVGEHSGGTIETAEGNWKPNHIVVLEFEKLEQLKKFYTSPEYDKIKNHRDEASKSNIIFVDNDYS